jgi:hypothetical protein
MNRLLILWRGFVLALLKRLRFHAPSLLVERCLSPKKGTTKIHDLFLPSMVGPKAGSEAAFCS